LKLSKLSHFDSSFTIVSGDSEANIEQICDKYSFSENSLFFCKDDSFLEEAVKCKNKKFGLVFEKLPDDLPKDFLFIATVENIAMSMCHLSKPFFDIYQEGLNDEVDGRQMGTTDIHPTAVIAQHVFVGQNVKIAKNCKIHPGVVIMSESELGEGCEIFPSSVLHPKSILGSNVRISSNCTIGSDGFGYNFKDGVHHKIWHSGGVILGDNVEMGSGCTIDQGTFSPTNIGAGSKLDNQVHIAHNVHVGRGVILCGQIGLSGSSSLGDYCVLGGKVGIGPDCSIGEGSHIAGNAMVTTSWPKGSVLGGHPARALKEWMRGVAYLRKHSLKK
jgi:UDP-3-O-[3-hydroxymyristoyl] glucosamine N-acyltransferase